MSKPPPAAREIIITPRCLQDLAFWVETDRATALKILSLLDLTTRDPLGGIGKPELLKHLGSGYMSRRITQEHRLVYRVVGQRVQFLSARFHYDKAK